MNSTELILVRTKFGDSLSKISQLTELTIDQVKETFGQATGLNAEEMNILFTLKQIGRSLEQISQEVQVALDILNQFLTDPKESVVGLDTQIGSKVEQSKETYKTSRYLGVNERPVLAYTLDSPDNCQTCVTEASDKMPSGSRATPTTTEETKAFHKPESTNTLLKPQHSIILPTFIYTCM
jgi:hypothetical protein